MVRRGVKEDAGSQGFEPNADNDVLTILDANFYPDLAEQGLGREIINRLQRLRKKAGLVPTDDVRMEYAVLSDPDQVGIEKAFESQSKAIEKAVRRPLEKNASPNGDDEGMILQEEQDVQKATFLLRLLKL